MNNQFGGFELGPSQFAGGGFVASPPNGTGAAPEFGSGGNKGTNRAANQTMRDVTIRQLIREEANNSDDSFKVDGVDLTTFFIVGRVVSRMEDSTVLKLKLDDGTGVMEVVLYLEIENELLNMAAKEWNENTYVRVSGSLRTSEGKRSMLAYRIKTVKDFNEVVYHKLQCIFQHLHLTKGVAPPASGPQPAFGATAPIMPTGAIGGAGGAHSKLNEEVLLVYNQVPAPGDNGFDVKDIHAHLIQRGINVPYKDVKVAVDFLCNEGHLYSTSDDNHHKSAGV